MIYGIKQIEKQFPGFEARFCDAVLFDMREIFLSHSMDKLEGEDKLKEFSDSISGDYWDLMRPPSEKMYLIVGKKPVTFNRDTKMKLYNQHVSTEYALEFGEVTEDTINIDRVYISDFYHKEGKCFVSKYKDIHLHRRHVRLLHPESGREIQTVFTLDRAIVEVASNGWIKSMFGKHSNPSLANYRGRQMIIEKSNEDLGNLYLDVKIALFYLNIRNIKQRTEAIPGLRGYYFPERWGREYKVLSLSQTLTEHSPGPDLPPGYHVRGHFQRGHFKRKKTGVYWWNPHWRGDFSKGIVMKDYKVKAAEG